MIGAIVGMMILGTFNPSILTISIAHAEEKVWTQSMVKEFARDVAKESDLNVQKFLHTLNRENGFNATGQSNYVDKNGDREDSWGACQLNLHFNPTITREQAENPAFCIPFMAEEWSKGRAWKWSAWKLYNRIGWPEEVI
jgi:hypothetical protein